ncbi:MAG: peptidoglycan DD-metalloendopeptidase family protein [Bacteroidales bacterium]
MESTKLTAVLSHHRHDFEPVTPFDLQSKKLCYLDLSAANPDLGIEQISDNALFSETIKAFTESAGADIAIGRYDEDRSIYTKSEHFTPPGQEPRTLHLGVDLWMTAGTSIHAPLAARVHSFNHNDNYGDYGPTIILAHELEGILFYTLYGHLSLASLKDIFEGQHIAKGQAFCTLGSPDENGQWPAHLHFQLISNMMGKKGDFPGVAKCSEREKFLKICPDPGLILGISTTGPPGISN